MKKCLLMFFGLPRTFEECSKNINKNLIDNNKECCEFTIIISTDINGKEHDKWNGKRNRTNYDQTILETKLHSTYKNIKNILYLSGPLYHYSPFGSKSPTIIYERLAQLLTHEKNNSYDYYIFSRMDIKLIQPIKLSDYTNKFSMITRGPNKGGGGMFYIRDWDYMWIGCEKSFNLWCINMLKFGYTMKSNKESKTSYLELLHDNKYICNTVENYNDISIEDMLKNGSKYNALLGSRPQNETAKYCSYYVKLFHRLIILLEQHNCAFEIGKNFTQLSS
jgi:hypothetical protein